VLWEREVGARIISSLSLPAIDTPGSRPDAPDLFDAFVDAVRWSSATSAPLLAPWQSAIQVEDYQLYPVLKALLMPRVTLLLADDVGLGKTIEAGLILTELIARRRLRRALVVCPAALQTRWRAYGWKRLLERDGHSSRLEGVSTAALEAAIAAEIERVTQGA
jgi:SNF2 family DNA or RNA helicase